jgi:hypothetical protein
VLWEIHFCKGVGLEARSERRKAKGGAMIKGKDRFQATGRKSQLVLVVLTSSQDSLMEENRAISFILMSIPNNQYIPT